MLITWRIVMCNQLPNTLTPRRSCRERHRGLRRPATRPRNRRPRRELPPPLPPPPLGFPASCGGAAATPRRVRCAAGTPGTGSSGPGSQGCLFRFFQTVGCELALSRSAGVPSDGFRKIVRHTTDLASAYGYFNRSDFKELTSLSKAA